MATKFRREFKNVVYNYSDAEAKVREATSNDPWGPSSALMSELADYTYHVEAYALVMGMLWKRLNDHGRNWRHVYKALVVLEYLVKTGSERVAQQCKENVFSIQTLKDFQFIDKDGKDQGSNVREKAKQLVAFLKDSKKMQEERVRALQARERQEGVSSGTSPSNRRVQFKETVSTDGDTTESGQGRVQQDVEQARPSNMSEEELQLKLALQLSKQQADEEEVLRNQEEESLRAAIALSQAETEKEEKEEDQEEEQPQGDLLLDLNTSGVVDPWAAKIPEAPPSYDDVTSGLVLNDPWATIPSTTAAAPITNQDPFLNWGGITINGTSPEPTTDPWAAIPNISQPSTTTSLNPFDLSDLGVLLPPAGVSPSSTPQLERIEDKFLGHNANLVDLNTLTAPPSSKPESLNPFSTVPSQHKSVSPFDVNKPPAPTLHQLAASSQGYPLANPLPAPLIPLANQPQPTQSVQPFGATTNQTLNPFS